MIIAAAPCRKTFAEKTMRFLLILVLGCRTFMGAAQNELQQVDFKTSLWKTLYGKVEVKPFMGREALFLDKGIAYLPGTTFANGEIDVDIAPTIPGFGGVVFHMDSAFNFEEVYIRNLKSGWPDAAQYSPVFNGESSWQLYPEYQAQLKYPATEWIHVKVIVQHQQARVYFLSADTAQLLVDSLRVPNAGGMIGLWSLQGAYFSNLTYRETAVKEAPLKILTPANPRAIRKWSISPVAPFHYDQVTHPDFAVLRSLKWKEGETERDGLLNINRFARKRIFGKFKDNSEEVVWLRYDWEEPASGVKPLSFEFTNRCFVYINEQKVFAGNNSFRLKGPLDRGSIDKQAKANVIYLPVKKGRNSLMVAVAGVANGWGFLGAFEDNSQKGFTTF
jgi:hypothetical protein